MDPRTENILNAVIESFIKSGSPVSSGWLYEKYNFGIKPAMIRHELETLTDSGFLEQPYHSAGRVPSDKAYEIFAEKLLAVESEPNLDEVFLQSIRSADWPNFLTLFSNQLGLLGALEQKNEDRIYKTGLETLLNRLDWENQNEIREIIRDFEELDEKVENLNDEIFEACPIQVFIGQKSPVTESRELAVVAQRCYLDGENILILAIGPKRMNYKKVVKTFKGLKNLNERRTK
ncbi:MAG: hypothetical protein HY093_00815 [Candidatus Liptonbacteria bacterium]|nr:hypothetical protein [Candidatus Liptonbacteria bacterium]